MPGEFSNTGAFDALDSITGRATITSGTTYLALLTAVPTDTTTPATMTEYAATGYARIAITWTAPALNGSSIPETSNTALITYGPFTAGTGATISGLALVTSASGTSGVLKAWWTPDVNRTPAVNDYIQFAIGALKLTVD